MQWSELQEMARGQVEQARAVLAAYPRDVELAAVTLSDPARSAQSFGSCADRLSWLDLIIFHYSIREARNHNPDAFYELPRQLRVIEQEFGLA